MRPKDFNQYGTRRGNHQVMMRGTFANIRIKNQMLPGVEGGMTMHYPSRQKMTTYDAAMRYKHDNVLLVVFAGREYGTGFVARLGRQAGTALLGIRAVIGAVVRAHPPREPDRYGRRCRWCFEEGTSWQTCRASRAARKSRSAGCTGELKPRQRLIAEMVAADGGPKERSRCSAASTRFFDEFLEYFKNGGILQYCAAPPRGGGGANPAAPLTAN